MPEALLPASMAETVTPDDILRDFARGPQNGRTYLDAEDVALLNMILPDICGELLAYRLAHRAWAQAPATGARGVAA